MARKKDNSSNNSPKQAVIENDTPPQAAYVSQKCNRLASALYAVTRFLAHDEPLKSKIRNLALSLSEIARRPPQGSAYADLSNLLTQIRDKLTIARDGGLLSSMNHQVLANEISNLQDRLRDGELSYGPRINRDYFELEHSLPDTAGRNKSTTRSSNSVQANDQTDTGTSSSPMSAKDKRRQKILDLFEDADEITVNDVTEVINGYSTKTIQRDLKALVKSGKLEKHGKRRWTSYTRA